MSGFELWQYGTLTDGGDPEWVLVGAAPDIVSACSLASGVATANVQVRHERSGKVAAWIGMQANPELFVVPDVLPESRP